MKTRVKGLRTCLFAARHCAAPLPAPTFSFLSFLFWLLIVVTVWTAFLLHHHRNSLISLGWLFPLHMHGIQCPHFIVCCRAPNQHPCHLPTQWSCPLGMKQEKKINPIILKRRAAWRALKGSLWIKGEVELERGRNEVLRYRGAEIGGDLEEKKWIRQNVCWVCKTVLGL